MYRSTLRRRHQHAISSRSLVAFLLVSSFGILFVGCSSNEPKVTAPLEEEFTFTEQDLERFRELARQAQDDVSSATATGSFVPRLDGGTGATAPTTPGQPLVLDLSQVSTYEALRATGADAGANVYRVTNVFLNVRQSPAVTAAAVGRLEQGDTVEVLDFADAAWARVKLADGQEGFVSTRYIAKLVPEERLPEEKKAFEGMYFVDFGFLNVRKSPDSQSELLGELAGQAIIRPLSMDQVWARISFNGGEGYVASEYLSPFLPNFLVRQDRYALPILHYRLNQEGVVAALGRHVDRLRADGYRIWTLRDLRELVLAQEERDVRIEPRTVVLAISDLSAENLQQVSDLLIARNAPATLFLPGKELGIDGITERQVVTLIANGFDVQSGAHSGDDLRSMTNSQVEIELRQSRQMLEDYTDREVFAVSYPWGGVNERVTQVAGQSGYLFGVGAAPAVAFTRNEFLQLPSLLVSGSMTEDDMLGLLRGQ
jgi:peptidoglycan/xylan/chitin deacetylase (PgdA/CDA1 family)/SH3-like domain-containing protein